MVRVCIDQIEWRNYIIWNILLILFSKDVHGFVNVRLENGNGNGAHEGSVEITTDLYNWQIICGSSEFDILDVIVICRQLGYPGANRALASSPYPAGNYPMSTTAFRCSGNEYHLNNCSYIETRCASRQVAGAVCYRQDSGYLGCFTDLFTDPVLTGADAIDSAMTRSRCLDFCITNGFVYAGLKFGTKCTCGSEGVDYARYGKISDSECHYRCGGAPSESCGGYETLAVFRVASNRPRPTSRPMTTLTSFYQNGRTTTKGTGYNRTQPEVTYGYPSTPAVTVRMVAKEGNFINQPSGIAVVISLSAITVILVLAVVFLVRRRSSPPDSKRKPSNRPYEEITLDIKEIESPETTPNNYCENGDVPLSTPLVITPRSHTYEQADLFSYGERNSEMYSTVPDVVSESSSSAPESRSKPTTPPAIRDLYAKPHKERARRVPRKDTGYETIEDEDLRVDPKSYLGGGRGVSDGDGGPESSHTGYSTIENGGDLEESLNLDEMYAKPLKKEHRKAVREDSFDETCMVENELYTSTDS
ncbi:uncharacterized protein LOC129280303 isoform X1 [Lytechinus pictus]|uniref:uncharacterized protein LOC129280303 isoform X1 n=1 Tax=Lytechinus pictus TaxID=7653 RepID=UPI0030B9C8A3